MRALWFPAVALCVGGLGYGAWVYAGGDPTLQIPWLSVAFGGAATQPGPGGPVSSRDAVERRLREVPAYERFFSRVRNVFPADYAAIIDSFVDRLDNRLEADAADLYVFEAYGALRQTRGVVAAKAGPEALTRLFDTRAALLQALAADDAHLCSDFLYGSTSQRLFDFSAVHRALVANMVNAGLEAIIDGHAKKVDRAKPTDDDLRLLEGALTAKGLTRAEIDALVDGKAPDPPIEEGRMCRAGQASLEALKSLPNDARLRLYALSAQLMARS